MGGSKWAEDDARHETPADRDRLIAWLQAESRRIMAEACFGGAIEDALEEAEGWADYKARRAAARKRVELELDFSAYLAQNGYTE